MDRGSNREGDEMDNNFTENMEDNQMDTCEEYFTKFLSHWERQRHMAAVQAVCNVTHMICVMKLYCCSRYVDRSVGNIFGERENVRRELMTQLSTNEKCRDILRMGPNAFARLCELLRATGRLKDNKNSIVEEQVAKFLYVLAHNAKNRTISFFFRRSGETISRHFHEVLRAIITLEDQFLRQPNGVEVSQEIVNSHSVIERAFGVLKKRFPIISTGTESHFSVRTLTKIVLACCILHNYLMGVDPDEQILREVDQELWNSEPQTEDIYSTEKDNEEARLGTSIRDEIAKRMWQEYQSNG
ncbi:hypothetical protein EZV62_018323 [Acer yangbiense]|uniref:Uncharacterized protein n=1 Tax=Acer yangbiense TaxID=1000413 RepID=A0A5C7HJ43_9ROSI|nr:hypothetical protein EZV62_018323 [Acer yangbiense]